MSIGEVTNNCPQESNLTFLGPRASSPALQHRRPKTLVMAGLDPATQGQCRSVFAAFANLQLSSLPANAGGALLGGRVKPGHDDCGLARWQGCRKAHAKGRAQIFVLTKDEGGRPVRFTTGYAQRSPEAQPTSAA